MSADLRDIVAPLLKMAVWYTQLKNEPQAQKVYAEAIKRIEEDGPRDPQLVQVLQDYSRDLRSVGKSAEADQLAAYARHILTTRTDVFYPDGTERPWFDIPAFHSRIPPFPAEFKSSHGRAGGCGCWILPVVTFAGGMALIGMLDKQLPDVIRRGGGGEFLVMGLAVCSVVLGIATYIRARAAAAWEGRNSWFKFTDDGVEFHSPWKHLKYQWNEITRVVDNTEVNTAEDSSEDNVTVHGPRGKFTISARFFKVEEVHLALGILKLKTGK